MGAFWRFLRQRVIRLAVAYPALIAVLMFLFLVTVSNHVYGASELVLQGAAFWHMLMMGTLTATFGALLLYELLRVYRRLAEVELVRTVVSTLHHEINNPLNVILLSAEKLQNLKDYDGPTVGNIVTSTRRISDAVAKLGDLEQEVRFRHDAVFTGLIDLDRSR